MVELHDVTGKASGERLLDMARYYCRDDVKAMLLRHQRYLLINIANEWGSHKVTAKHWLKSYTDAVREAISGPAEKYPPAESIENFLQMDFPELVYLSGSYLEGMTNIRNICMEMMHISEKELAAFSKKYTLEPQQDDEKKLERMATMMKAEETLKEARKKFPVQENK